MNRLWKIAARTAKGRPPVGSTPADVVHHENKWRLLRYRALPGAGPRPSPGGLATPVLLVPSLINRHYVLDLLPGKSFAEWLVQQGHDVFIIDWGTPEDEDRYLELDDIADRYLGRALRVARRISGSRRPPHVLGYCLGGTLATLHAAAHPGSMASLTLLAAPIGFHDGGLLSTWTRSPTFDVDALVAGAGNVPWPLMQAAFQMLRPTMAAAKLVGLVDRAWEDELLDSFFAIETWGNDNVSFPGACYRRTIQELYRDDALVNGTMTLGGAPARLEAIDAPLLVVTFEHDHIVPPAGAAVILDRVASTDKHRLHLAGGHVGAVISKKAAKGLWPAMSTFWRDRDAETASPAGGPRSTAGSAPGAGTEPDVAAAARAG